MCQKADSRCSLQNIKYYKGRCPIILAGTPPTIAPGGTSRVTPALAPTTAPRPIRTPLRMQACSPIHTSSSIITFPLIERGASLRMLWLTADPTSPWLWSVISTPEAIKHLLPIRSSAIAVTVQLQPKATSSPMTILGKYRFPLCCSHARRRSPGPDAKRLPIEISPPPNTWQGKESLKIEPTLLTWQRKTVHAMNSVSLDQVVSALRSMAFIVLFAFAVC